MSHSPGDDGKPKVKSFWQSVFRSGQQPGLRGIWNRSVDYFYGTVYSWIQRYQAHNGGRRRMPASTTSAEPEMRERLKMSTIPNDVIVVYGEDPFAGPGEPALNIVSKRVWIARDEWYASYGHQDFVDIEAELVDRFDLDTPMENKIAANSVQAHQSLLAALAEDPRFYFCNDIYDP